MNVSSSRSRSLCILLLCLIVAGIGGFLYYTTRTSGHKNKNNGSHSKRPKSPPTSPGSEEPDKED